MLHAQSHMPGSNQETGNASNPRSLQRIGLYLGPAVALFLLLFTDLQPGSPNITFTAALAVLMAIWWITEAVPLAITALIPVALFPLFGIMDGRDVASQYFNHIIFLFIGGFLIALAMQRWNLHKRIALYFLTHFSSRPAFIVLGFMITTAFLSMWISNTATVMMMIPIALSLIISLEEKFGVKEVKRFSLGLLLGIAYGASIGGIATLVGTPPNLSLARIFSIAFPMAPEIDFASWFRFAFPLSIIFLIITWLVLQVFFGRIKWKIDKSIFKTEYKQLGPMQHEEKLVLIVFIILIITWLTRADLTLGKVVLPGWGRVFPNPAYIHDGVVAIALGILLFILPSRGKGRLMTWETAKDIPWDIVLLFGGGFALASAFMESGLANWIGGEMVGVGQYPTWAIIASFSTMITFLTELTSNTATAEMILPVLAGLAGHIGQHPLILMIPATLSCSFAFMMPVATPPNAIIFGTHRIKVIEMVKVGLVLNFIGVLLVTAAVLLFGHLVGADCDQIPSWITQP